MSTIDDLKIISGVKLSVNIDDVYFRLDRHTTE